jgi:adenylate cyclase
MKDASATEIGAWITTAGLAGAAEPDLLHGFCERAVAAGLPLARALILINTLHPVYEGRVFRWRRDAAPVEGIVAEYGRTSEGGEAAERWRSSPFYHLLETGGSALRRNLARGDPADFASIEELRSQGHTDYLALIQRFAADGVIGEMDCVYSSWATDAPSGFTEGQVEALTGLVPALALAVKCASLARIAGTLVETYLGRDAGRRVLSGRITRGVAVREFERGRRARLPEQRCDRQYCQDPVQGRRPVRRLGRLARWPGQASARSRQRTRRGLCFARWRAAIRRCSQDDRHT